MLGQQLVQHARLIPLIFWKLDCSLSFEARWWSEGNSQIAHRDTESVWKGAFHDFSKGSEYRNTTTPETHHGVATVRGSIRKIPGWIPTRRIVRHHRVGVGVSTSDPGFPRFEQCVSTRNQKEQP